MGPEDINKFLQRAEEERQLGASTSNQRTAEQHRDLADKYEAVAKTYSKVNLVLDQPEKLRFDHGSFLAKAVERDTESSAPPAFRCLEAAPLQTLPAATQTEIMPGQHG